MEGRMAGEGVHVGFGWRRFVANRMFLQSTNGPTRHSPQAHALQHHLQPSSGGEDARWQACVPPPQKARHCAQVRRLRYRAARRTFLFHASRTTLLLTSTSMHVGPCAPSSPVRHDFEDPEDCSQGVRWITMRWLHEVSVRSKFSSLHLPSHMGITIVSFGHSLLKRRRSSRR